MSHPQTPELLPTDYITSVDNLTSNLGHSRAHIILVTELFVHSYPVANTFTSNSHQHKRLQLWIQFEKSEIYIKPKLRDILWNYLLEICEHVISALGLTCVTSYSQHHHSLKLSIVRTLTATNFLWPPYLQYIITALSLPSKNEHLKSYTCNNVQIYITVDVLRVLKAWF